MTGESLRIHIHSDDFFGTLATILDLLRQDSAHGYKPRHDLLLQQLRDDLLYMQGHYRITESQASEPNNTADKFLPSDPHTSTFEPL